MNAETSRDAEPRGGESPEFVPEDAALSALLATLPPRPAPPGFRDAVLAAIAAETPAVDRAAEPVPPAGTSRLRRAARFAGGVALTAAALGIAALLFPLVTEEAREVAVDPAAGPAGAAAPTGPAADAVRPPLPARNATARRAGAPAELAEAEEAGEFLEADAADAPAYEYSTTEFHEERGGERYGRVAKIPGFDEREIRVVRVTSTSLLSNQLAVRQFESAAVRNSIPKRAVEPIAGAALKPDGDADGTAGRDAGGFGDGSLQALPDAANADGVVGVLVVAEPERIAATLRDFRADLAADDLTAGNRIAEAEFSRTRLSPDAADRLPDADGDAAGLPAPPPSEAEPAAARPMPPARNGLGGGGLGGGLGGGGVGSMQERQPAESLSDATAEEATAFGAGRAGDGRPRYQMRVAPPWGRGRTAGPDAARAVEQSADPPAPSDPAGDSVAGATPPSLQTQSENDPVPVLLLFEPPAAPAEPGPR